MTSGEILFYRNFPYSDGGVPTDKLLIVLNTPQNDSPYLVVKTTKQKKSKSDRQGCHSQKGYFVFKSYDDFFKEDSTWVLFDQIIELNAAEFLTWSLKKGVQSRAQLKAINFKALINCIKSCPDVSKLHKSLL